MGKTFGASAGFTLPSKAVPAADAAWILKERWKKVDAYHRPRFAHITPDFILEIRSLSDSLKAQQEKIEEWLEAGVRLAFLIDPIERCAWSYRADREPLEVSNFSASLFGEDVLPGFELPLSIFND